MTGAVHGSGSGPGVKVTPALPDPILLAEQRRRARRTALLLGLVALCTYVGFILVTGLRH